MKKCFTSVVAVVALLAALLVLGGAAPAAYAWTDTGGPGGAGGVTSMVYDGTRDVLYAGTVTGGVLRCKSASTAPVWEVVGGSPYLTDVEALAYDPVRNILYAGGAPGDGMSVWRRPAPHSAGTWADISQGSWVTDPDPQHYDMTTLSFANDTLFAGTRTDDVWKVQDPHLVAPPPPAITDWVRMNVAWVSTTWVNCLCADTTNTALFCGLPGNTGIWRCDNAFNATPPYVWVQMGNDAGLLGGISLEMNAARNRLYASTRNSTNGKYQVWRTDAPNAATPTWTDLNYPAADSWKTLNLNALSYDETDGILYVGGQQGVYRVQDVNGTPSWTNIGSAIASKDVDPVTYGATGDTVFAGTGTDGVWSAAVPAPTISSISPTIGDVGTEVTINGSNFGSARGTSFVSYGSTAATDYSSWGDTQVKCDVPVGVSGEVDVTLTTYFGGESNAKTFTVTHPTWYLAEGSTDWGFATYISMENPNSTDVTARITYNTRTGTQDGGDHVLPAESQTTIYPADIIGATDFSTKVECLEGETIAVDRTMKWTGPGAASEEGHAAVGVTAPDTTWYLPEGSSAWGFECWLLIQNPGATEATCTVTYMIEGEGPAPVTKTVAAGTRATFNMADDIGARDASIQVESNVPVIPERAMYRNNRREGHDSTGTTAAANNYFLAEGSTNWGFTTYVLVQNPNATDTTVTITYMTSDFGPQPQTPFVMAPGTRTTIRANDYLAGHDLSTLVTGTQPIIAERAMYWDAGLGEACHDSIGMDAAHKTFYLPDGETINGRETWTLVQNPGVAAVNITVTYFPEGGGTPVTFTDSVDANSRKTYNMADSGVFGRAAVQVTCDTAGGNIMCERAMYWNNRGAGTDTIGGFSD
ncbi:MAG: IPT/TIG domain-containing protein [Actinobacteria bacterium]|nr:IPT/TIG domain-containing protein [Actinomycetota bacterium]MBU1942347.1 IPT/TIG domain-containing protein [Actinomycetota bacterium]MBU2686341.1 IPT/TIG domain-containing protein [Actinomycetota bacterium]